MPNRLQNASSPYLLQHKNNPVDWWEWEPQAFEKAEKENKPIFLSVGYSTCHWCHVMAHESFENEEIANYLNENFISIKVDREERPDIDALYMSATQMMTGSGGWPMSVFMDAQKRPFYCGTYFPPEERFGRPGFLTVLKEIRKAWDSERDNLERNSEIIVNKLKGESTGLSKEKRIDRASAMKAYEQLSQDYDEEQAGFGNRPKFPAFHNIIFLTRVQQLFLKEKKDEEAYQALNMALATIIKISRGGISDQLGGGLHRYSTDKYWLLPHFEKMLYDQGMYLWVLGEMLMLDMPKEYREYLTVLASETHRYLEGNLREKQGYYKSAEDADTSEGEGAYYVFSIDEIESILKGEIADEDINELIDIFNAEKEGNYLDEATHRQTGKNILTLFGNPELEHPLTARPYFRKAQGLLLEAREKRERPMIDDKILADWNSLLAIGYLKIYISSGNEEFLQRGRAIIDNINEIIQEKGALPHLLPKGQRGMLDDYAYFLKSVILLFSITGDSKYLESIRLITAKMEHFRKGDKLVLSVTEGELPAHPEPGFDSAIPSATSLIYGAHLMLRSIGIDGASIFPKAVEGAVAEKASLYPRGFSMLLSYYLEEEIGRSLFVVMAKKGDLSELVRQIHLNSGYGSICIPIDISDKGNHQALKNNIAWLPELPQKGEATLYKCENFACGLPIMGMDAIKAYINN